jgi:hypothetical protein
MMRNDREDLRDIAFILEQEIIGVSALSDAFKNTPVLGVPELQAIFLKAQPRVLDLARSIETARSKGAPSNSAGYPFEFYGSDKPGAEKPHRMGPEKDLGLSL